MNGISEDCPIWLVEDSPADVALLRYAFEQYGIIARVEVYSDGEAAIRRIEEIDRKTTGGSCACFPRLAVLDMNLPKCDGIEVLERLRKSSVLSRVPVIVFTSSESERDRAMSTELGAKEYVLKALDLDQFASVGAVVKRFL